MRPGEVTYEVRTECPGEAKALALRVVKGMGMPSSSVVEARAGGSIRYSFYTASRSEAAALRRRAVALHVAPVRVTVKTLKNSVWQNKWKKDFRPFRITDTIRIVPAWRKGRVRPFAGKDIYIDSTMAFGTGMHETTKAMARFLETVRGRYTSVLDVGTGTGILALIALAYGAKDVNGVDIAADAVATARLNFKLNRCRCGFLKTMDFGAGKLERRFDFVAANILAPALIGMRDRLVEAVGPGGFLAISGIWRNDISRIVKRYAVPSLRQVAVQRNGGWVSVLFEKVSDCIV